MTAIYRGPERPGYTPGQKYSIQSQNMTGKRYTSTEDKKGKPETRVMVWKQSGNPELITIEGADMKTQFEVVM